MSNNTAERAGEQDRILMTKREWKELENILMALETLNWIDEKGELDPAPLSSLGKGIELRMQRLVRHIRLRVDPDTPYDPE